MLLVPIHPVRGLVFGLLLVAMTVCLIASGFRSHDWPLVAVGGIALLVAFAIISASFRWFVRCVWEFLH